MKTNGYLVHLIITEAEQIKGVLTCWRYSLSIEKDLKNMMW